MVLNGAGEGDVLTATAAANLRPSTMTLIQPNVRIMTVEVFLPNLCHLFDILLKYVLWL